MKANAPGNAGDMLTTRDFNGKELQVNFQMEGRREMDVQSMRANQRDAVDWAQVDWGQVKHQVESAQQKIFRDTQAGNFKEVKHRQKLLAGSLAARLWAVRLVCEVNRGKNTPGIDGCLYTTGEQKVALAESLTFKGYISRPVRIVFIPKPTGGKRRLGIPTLRDRAMQALVLLAMNPEWEAKFEPNSFGFRPGRSTIDAVSHITRVLLGRKGAKPHPGWVLDADISKCFDTIDHEALLAKIGGSPFQGIIRSWLKSGAVGPVGFELTEKGTPQGGVISPLLANIALDGLERQFGIFSRNGVYINPSKRAGLNRLIAVYRYADDFIVLAPSREVVVNYIIPMVKAFLATVGLSLSEAKTRVVNVSEGFDFLGFTFRRFYQRNGNIRKFTYFPSRERLDRFMSKLRMYVNLNVTIDVVELIAGVNRRVIGACNYYKWSNAHDAFGYLTFRLWELMWQWAKKRHPKRGSKWIRDRYWKAVGGSKWVFSFHGSTVVQPYTLTVQWWKRPMARILTSPFDAKEADYWARRRKRWNEDESGSLM